MSPLGGAMSSFGKFAVSGRLGSLPNVAGLSAATIPQAGAVSHKASGAVTA